MKAFIANTKQLLQLDRAIPGQENFDQNKRQLCIPLYPARILNLPSL